MACWPSHEGRSGQHAQARTARPGVLNVFPTRAARAGRCLLASPCSRAWMPPPWCVFCGPAPSTAWTWPSWACGCGKAGTGMRLTVQVGRAWWWCGPGTAAPLPSGLRPRPPTPTAAVARARLWQTAQAPTTTAPPGPPLLPPWRHPPPRSPFWTFPSPASSAISILRTCPQRWLPSCCQLSQCVGPSQTHTSWTPACLPFSSSRGRSIPPQPRSPPVRLAAAHRVRASRNPQPPACWRCCLHWTGEP